MRIFFVHSGTETFVKMDYDLLSSSFEVQDFYAAKKFPADFLQYWRGIKDADVVFCWFASWNSFWTLLFTRLTGKKTVLVIGGYDIANMPEAHYGHQRGGIQKYFSRWSMKLADRLLTFSNFSRQEAGRNAGIPSEKIQVVYLGVPDLFGYLPAGNEERIALTVGRVNSPNLKRKGLQAFVQSAAFLPDVQFILVGEWADSSIDYLREIASPNVIFTGRVNDLELLEYYRKASVYVQASLHEGFGLSVAEAMLAGCIPVVANVGSLPEVVGECGFYIESTDLDAITSAIRGVFSGSKKKSSSARDRILRLFPFNKRLEALQAILNQL